MNSKFKYLVNQLVYHCFRVMWTAVVLLAMSFFLWFMSERLIYLKSNPKAVDVEVIYTDTVEFPAVTICNQNLFRYHTSPAHRNIKFAKLKKCRNLAKSKYKLKV